MHALVVIANLFIVLAGLAVLAVSISVWVLLCMRGWRDFRWSQRDRIIHSALVILILGTIAAMAGIGACTIIDASVAELLDMIRLHDRTYH